MKSRSGIYTVGEFMTKKEDLKVVKPTTSVDDGMFSTCVCAMSTYMLLFFLVLYLKTNFFLVSTCDSS